MQAAGGDNADNSGSGSGAFPSPVSFFEPECSGGGGSPEHETPPWMANEGTTGEEDAAAVALLRPRSFAERYAQHKPRVE